MVRYTQVLQLQQDIYNHLSGSTTHILAFAEILLKETQPSKCAFTQETKLTDLLPRNSEENVHVLYHCLVSYPQLGYSSAMDSVYL